MDTSETYVKMCEKAEEIQALWHSQDLIGKSRSNRGFGLHYEMGYEGSFYWNGEAVACVDYEYETGYAVGHIWLPRQDQLQEMVFDSYEITIPYAMSKRLCEWCAINTTGHIASMEQLWLAFVMKEKYNKIWKEDDWTYI